MIKSALLPFLLASAGAFAAAPEMRVTSDKPASSWEHAMLSGNGTVGLMMMGDAYHDTLYLSHTEVYLPYLNPGQFPALASRIAEVRNGCLAGNYGLAGSVINQERAKAKNFDKRNQGKRDPFIGVCRLKIDQNGDAPKDYERYTDYMTGETGVTFADQSGTIRRSAFASRTDQLIAVSISGKNRTTTISLSGIPSSSDEEAAMIADGVKRVDAEVREGLLYFRMLFKHQNEYNSLTGVEAAAKVITSGGACSNSTTGINCQNADEIVVLVKIRPLRKTDNTDSKFNELKQALDAVAPDYDKLLAGHARIHGEMMGRVTLDLNASTSDRKLSNDALNMKSLKDPEPLAKIERAFMAGRYNIICSSGYNPPNLQGLWTGTWAAAWYGSFTTNGNLPCALAFGNMGNTPEVMHAFFDFVERQLPGYRLNAREIFGTRGFHVPAQLTVSPRETDYSPAYPHCWWHAGAAWFCQFYYDYYLYTGDRKFLAGRAYPLMKEAIEFYEDFLTETDKDGKYIFVPCFSPENKPLKGPESTINATMEISAAKQLLRNAIAASKTLGIDAKLREKWSAMIDKMPSYQTGSDGSFREWLWPGLDDRNEHRHVSQLYALYDGAPDEIVKNPALTKAVAYTIRKRMDFNENKSRTMAFGYIQNGLAACHIGDAALAGEIINFTARRNWTDGMGSFHDIGHIFNTDISGGYPYLIASALVYSEPDKIRFLPAKPKSWKQGSVTGLRLRGNVLLKKLNWENGKAMAVICSAEDLNTTVEFPDGSAKPVQLKAGKEAEISFAY